MDVWSDVAREPQRRLVVLANRLYFFTDTNDEVRSKIDKQLHLTQVMYHIANGAPRSCWCGLDSGSTDLVLVRKSLDALLTGV